MLVYEQWSQFRQERGFSKDLADPPEGWRDIILFRDPNEEEICDIRVQIEIVIQNFVDVKLKSLNPDKADGERHFLARIADYSKEVEEFTSNVEGRKRTFNKGAGIETLRGYRRQDIIVLYYTSSEQEYEE